MPRRYPPLSPREVIAILVARSFALTRTRGSHEQYEGLIRGKWRRVTVDVHYSDFDDRLIKSMIRQSGLTREEFYGSTKRTARKINLRAKKYPIPLKD
ncbi:MAG: type II toxin-antitoxin system HicA family toxin [Anaerolineae bacterium]